jgi:hypothetical protein
VAQLLASFDDINFHLPEDKATMPIGFDDSDYQLDVYRYVRSLLTGTFDLTVLTSWTSPTNTPEIIRAIAGRLIAAKWYATLFSEDTDDESNLAQRLYNEATMMLQQVRDGTLTLIDAAGNEVVPTEDLRWSRDDFFPNNDVPPKFSMDQTFA